MPMNMVMTTAMAMAIKIMEFGKHDLSKLECYRPRLKSHNNIMMSRRIQRLTSRLGMITELCCAVLLEMMQSFRL